ncbi:hypothetical protein D3C72_605030 [compost metagenome]
MLRAVGANVGNRSVQISDHFHIQIQRQILIVILLRFYRFHFGRAIFQQCQSLVIRMQRHAALGHLFAQSR